MKQTEDGNKEKVQEGDSLGDILIQQSGHLTVRATVESGEAAADIEIEGRPEDVLNAWKEIGFFGTEGGSPGWSFHR